MSVLVIIPTYNERDNLPALVPSVLAHGYRVMVVDDSSPDGTGEVADRLAAQHPGRVSVIHRTDRRGFGRSYVDAYARALDTDATVICQMDADLSHDPVSLPDLVAALEDADLAIGSRYVQGISILNWPLHRIVLSVLANRYIRLTTGLRVHDCTSGFRAWRRESLARLALNRVVSEGYAFLVETLCEAKEGSRIVEVPIVFVERREGASKLSTRVLVESVIMPWRIRWRRIARRFDAERRPSARID